MSEPRASVVKGPAAHTSAAAPSKAMERIWHRIIVRATGLWKIIQRNQASAEQRLAKASPC
jgi:hypothetical protein